MSLARRRATQRWRRKWPSLALWLTPSHCPKARVGHVQDNWASHTLRADFTFGTWSPAPPKHPSFRPWIACVDAMTDNAVTIQMYSHESYAGFHRLLNVAPYLQ